MMRPTPANIAVRSNSDVQSQRMSFDENSIEFLMDVMTNLYNDPVLAPIREYASNARDSHIDAGRADVPVQVTLPTNFAPSYIVQDFGLGMSVDDLFNVYAKYGYSTKRDTDTQTGMLGLGSKSGLTYTDQFNVTAIKDGVKTFATVARGEDGAGTINIIDTVQTDERNGVTIDIPVHDVPEFRSKAERFFRWWTTGTVLVDGEQPAYPDDDIIKVTDDIIVHKTGIDQDYVVMGEVAYGVGDRLSHGLPWGYRVAAYVPMGAVNFPPNREGLQYTERTNKVIEDINTRRINEIKAAAERDIANAKTHADAVRATVTWDRLLSGETPQYNGLDVPNYVLNREGFYYYDFNRYRNNLTTRTQIETVRFVDCLVITGFTNKSLSVQNRRKIKFYMEQQGYDQTGYIATDSMFGEPWSDGVTQVPWDDIKPIRVSSGGTARPSGSSPMFDIYDETNKRRTMELDDIDDDDLIMVSPALINTRNRDTVHITTITDLFPDATLVILARNRWDKFAKAFDNVRPLDEAVNDLYDHLDATLTDYQYLELTSGSYDIGMFGKLDDTQIDDPELAKLVRESKNSESKTSMYYSLRRVRAMADIPYRELAERDTGYPKMLDKYPFIRYAGRSDVSIEHIHEYINLFYAKDAT